MQAVQLVTIPMMVKVDDEPRLVAWTGHAQSRGMHGMPQSAHAACFRHGHACFRMKHACMHAWNEGPSMRRSMPGG